MIDKLYVNINIMPNNSIEILNTPKSLIKAYWNKLDFNKFNITIKPKERLTENGFNVKYENELSDYINSDNYKKENNKIFDSWDYLLKLKKDIWI